MTVTQFFFGRCGVAGAKSSDWFPKSWLHAEVASQSHLRTRCKLLGRSGDHWHLIILCKPLLRQYQLCKGEAGICPSSSTSSPGMANAASATWLISWAKSKFQNPMVYRCLSSFSPLNLPFWGIWNLVSTFLGQPPIWSFLMLCCNFSTGVAKLPQGLQGAQLHRRRSMVADESS